VRLSNRDLLDLVGRNLLLAPVVKLRSARRRGFAMVCAPLQLAVVPKVRRDAGGAEGVIANSPEENLRS
jgi:hypothetical protein